MFTIVYINKETIELKQDYLYELEDKKNGIWSIKEWISDRKVLLVSNSLLVK